MRFLLLFLFLSLTAIPAAEAKGKNPPSGKDLQLGAEEGGMGFRPSKKVDRVHGLGNIDTGAGTGRHIVRVQTKAPKPKPRPNPKPKTKKAPEVLGPNDKCFIPEDNITSAQ